MTPKEILELIAETNGFMDLHRDELVEAYRAIAACNKPTFVALCLHLAFLSGRDRAANIAKMKAEQTISWNQTARALAMSMLDITPPARTEPSGDNELGIFGK